MSKIFVFQITSPVFLSKATACPSKDPKKTNFSPTAKPFENGAYNISFSSNPFWAFIFLSSENSCEYFQICSHRLRTKNIRICGPNLDVFVHNQPVFGSRFRES